MPVLPAEVLHLPFGPGPYRMAMDLTSAAEAEWFEIDALYRPELAQKRHLLEARRDEVFAAEAGSEAARAETLSAVAAALARHCGAWFQCEGSILRNRLTDEEWDLSHPPLDPLELAARLVQEDLCLIQMSPAGPRLMAGVVCCPSRWKLTEKIGKPLGEVHAAVPLYADRLSRPVDRFMQHLKAGRLTVRLNWSLLDDPALFQPAGKWRTDHRPDITPGNAGERIFLRVERQTLRRLPASDAVLFGIRVHVYPLTRLVAQAGSLAAAVRALPPEIARYKSLLPFREALLCWLEEQARGFRPFEPQSKAEPLKSIP